MCLGGVADVGTAGPQCAGVDTHDSCLLPQRAACRVSGLCTGAELPTSHRCDAATWLKKAASADWTCLVLSAGLACEQLC